MKGGKKKKEREDSPLFDSRYKKLDDREGGGGV
jgi:hypothetical protein